jgi:hypothetical protein
MGVPSASARWVACRVNPNGRMADSLVLWSVWLWKCFNHTTRPAKLLTKSYSWEVNSVSDSQSATSLRRCKATLSVFPKKSIVPCMIETKISRRPFHHAWKLVATAIPLHRISLTLSCSQHQTVPLPGCLAFSAKLYFYLHR